MKKNVDKKERVIIIHMFQEVRRKHQPKSHNLSEELQIKVYFLYS